MDYEKLISLSSKGDKQALEDLLAFAQKLSAEKNHGKPTKVFRDPSIFYRIAVNTFTVTEPDNSEAYELNEECKLIKRWIKAHPTGISPLPRVVEGMTPWFIFVTVDYDILNERDSGGESWPLIPLIESAIFRESCIDNTQHHHYAGATTPSRLVGVMEDYFGIRPNIPATYYPSEARISRIKEAAQAPEDLKGLPLEVRIWVDLLADEIEKRFYASKTENSPPLYVE